MDQLQSRKIEHDEVFAFEFSVCTLVTNLAEYNEMLASFTESGFTAAICEFLYIDNSKQNTYEAFEGLNRFLREAKGKYIILCHQDILINYHNIDDLRARIAEIDNADSRWALIGNSGAINLKYTVMNVIQGNGNMLIDEYLPMKAITLDEDFIIVKSTANLALSADLRGFHMYGTDICLIAETLGYTAYTIDFKLTHKSDGNADEKFYTLKKDLIKKYRKAFRSRFVGTTITRFYISGTRLFNFLGNTGPVLFFVRQYYKAFKRQEHYQVKPKTFR